MFLQLSEPSGTPSSSASGGGAMAIPANNKLNSVLIATVEITVLVAVLITETLFVCHPVTLGFAPPDR